MSSSRIKRHLTGAQQRRAGDQAQRIKVGRLQCRHDQIDAPAAQCVDQAWLRHLVQEQLPVHGLGQGVRQVHLKPAQYAPLDESHRRTADADADAKRRASSSARAVSRPMSEAMHSSAAKTSFTQPPTVSLRAAAALSRLGWGPGWC
jgi:hypothetical protein